MSVFIRQAVAPVVPATSRLRPLGVDAVTLSGGFWGERQAVNLGATLPHIGHWLEREGWIANFDLVADGGSADDRSGREFSDSEVYKYLEAIAWTLGQPALDPTTKARWEATFRSIVSRVASAQESDGYLNTNFGHAGQAPRWSNLEWGHELYCLGHLFQAAVARMRAAPGADDGLEQMARRAADLVCEVFGESGIRSVCGHAEVEVGLAELARATGEERYAVQAELFIARRGHRTLADIEWGRSYFQDDVPVREATVLRGHAVRANYLAAGAVDVAVDGGDSGLLDALKSQWAATVARRTYITGGQGSHHQDEAFGADWELPPDRAYSETCAGIASIMFSWRLLLSEGDARYADLIERTLFNVVATSPSKDGTSFYYSNTLHQREAGQPADPDRISSRASSSQRAPWFEVSCCPPNVARTLASLAAYVATIDDRGIQLHQYASGSISTSLAGGQAVELDIETAYPRDGAVLVRIADGVESAVPWTISLRVPEWAASARLRYRAATGETVERTVGPGYADVTESFAAGDVIELVLPMAPRIVVPDPRIDAVRGCVAVERGPEVLCLESVDIVGSDPLERLELDLSTPLRESDGRVIVQLRAVESPDRDWAYRGSDDASTPTPQASSEASMRPYHSWAQRGPSTMRVWIPTAR